MEILRPGFFLWPVERPLNECLMQESRICIKAYIKI
jgi:hypothetical protein